jgi:3-dehydroquinate synthetase
MDAIQVDKKAEGGTVRFVLPTKIGAVTVTKEWDERQLRELLAE